MPRVDFDWEIGEGEPENLPPQGGDQSDAPAPKPGAAVERPAWPRAQTKRVVLIVACVLFLTGAIATAIVARHVEDVTAPLIKDVLAAHNLVRHAVTQSDEDLFDSLLYRGDAGWRTAYRQLFKQDALIDRAPLGLHAQADDARIAGVTLSPDMTGAEVVSEHAYAIDAGGGLTETVRLRQIAIYRFEKGQWLLAPPEDEFWGDWLTHEGRWLTLVYPESDAEFGRRLASDLDAVLEGLCAAQIGIGCPAGLH
ncbi:MAG TPA: hypothetical protein VFL17_18995, partial [Anaerolineae bacterium]|nr:hypothetical protein [Anaerolineae bacterium]